MKKDPFDYILPFHVSMCSYQLESTQPNKIPYPQGGGTLITFKNSNNDKIYAILTAAHVLEEIKMSSNSDFYITKLINRKGDICFSLIRPQLIFTIMDNKYFRAIKHNHDHENSNNINNIDLCIIILNINKIQNTKFYDNADFFDLDNNEKLKENLEIPIFFKGACDDSEIKNNILNTKIIIGKNVETKTTQQFQLKYYKFLIQKNESMKGASGSGVWQFSRIDDGPLSMSLKGIIIIQKKPLDPDRPIIITAMGINYPNYLKKKILNAMDTKLEKIKDTPLKN